jgi:hypothetical protein
MKDLMYQGSLGSRDVRILDWKVGLRECDVIDVDCCCTWDYLREFECSESSLLLP